MHLSTAFVAASSLLAVATAAPIHHGRRDLFGLGLSVNLGDVSNSVPAVTTATTSTPSPISTAYDGPAPSTMRTRVIARTLSAPAASSSSIMKAGPAYNPGMRPQYFGDKSAWLSSSSSVTSLAYAVPTSVSTSMDPVAPMSTPAFTAHYKQYHLAAVANPSNSTSISPSETWRPHAVSTDWPQLSKSITAAPLVTCSSTPTVTPTPPTTISLPSAIVTSPMTPPAWSSLRGNYSVSWSTLVPTAALSATVTAADPVGHSRVSSESAPATQAPSWPSGAFSAQTASVTGKVATESTSTVSGAEPTPAPGVTVAATSGLKPVKLYGEYPLLCIELRGDKAGSRPIPIEILNFLQEY